jgi:hypothetical protein
LDNRKGELTMLKQTALAATLALTAFPALAELEAHPGNHWNQGGTVYVSCFRGPWELVYWDRPEGVFVESLVEVGYDYTNALAIATRVCRDQTFVGHPELLRAEMERIIADAPH